MPNITKNLVALEKWDFPENATKQLIWRNFGIKLINLFTFLFVNYKGMLSFEIHYLSEDDLLAEQRKYHGPNDCVYDKVGEALLNLVITETGMMYAT